MNKIEKAQSTDILFEEMTIPTKVCSNCEEEKPITEFYRDKNKRMGRDGICKVCKNEKVRKSLERTTIRAFINIVEPYCLQRKNEPFGHEDIRNDTDEYSKSYWRLLLPSMVNKGLLMSFWNGKRVFYALPDEDLAQKMKTTKVCTKCGQRKAHELFSRQKKTKDGRQSVCKECMKLLYKTKYRKRLRKHPIETYEKTLKTQKIKLKEKGIYLRFPMDEYPAMHKYNREITTKFKKKYNLTDEEYNALIAKVINNDFELIRKEDNKDV